MSMAQPPHYWRATLRAALHFTQVRASAYTPANMADCSVRDIAGFSVVIPYCQGALDVLAACLVARAFAFRQLLAAASL
jgi:hypothetical protein